MPTANSSWKRALYPTVEALTVHNRSTHPFNVLLDRPTLIPLQTFNFPCFNEWFRPVDTKWSKHEIRYELWDKRMSNRKVPLEYTGPDPRDPSKQTFGRFRAPFSVFSKSLKEPVHNSRLYIAQMPLNELPKRLKHAIQPPTKLLRRYSSNYTLEGSSLWMGRPPTMTPLHRDPNANIFVQLAGIKKIRLFAPEAGERILQTVKLRTGTGGDMSGRMRGKEMMLGKEKEELEKIVWGAWTVEYGGLQANLCRGTGLYIPEGWWHSVKGIGLSGINASANWWFRLNIEEEPELQPSLPTPAGSDPWWNIY